MSYLINNQQKINEIVFAGRNKSYGAYVLRSEYGSTIFKSLSIMLLTFGSIAAVAFYLTNRNNKPDMNGAVSVLPEQDSNITVEVNLKQKPEPPAVQEPPAQNNSGSSAIATVISETASANTNTVLNENSGVGTNTNTEGPPGPVTPTNDIGTGTLSIPTNTATDTYYVADSNPEYEGGLKALYAFLASKLKYPEPAYEAGKEGTVYVKFVVDQNGKVCSVALLNHLGFGLDEEALRVVGLIPNFKTPGMMAGKPVRVYYQLPLKFRMH